MTAEDLTACLNLLFKTHPGKRLEQGRFLVMPEKAQCVPCPQDHREHPMTSKRVTAKDSSSVQVYTNGSVALKFVADNIYRSSACNAAAGRGRCIHLVGGVF